MTEIVYVDTCIYMDLFKTGRANKWIDFYEVAYYFFKKLENGDYNLMISDWLIEQLRRNSVLDQAEELFKRFSNDKKLIQKNKTAAILSEAENYLHWEDAVHALIAITNKADCFITRNFPDYEEFCMKIRLERPEAF